MIAAADQGQGVVKPMPAKVNRNTPPIVTRASTAAPRIESVPVSLLDFENVTATITGITAITVSSTRAVNHTPFVQGSGLPLISRATRIPSANPNGAQSTARSRFTFQIATDVFR